MSEQATTELIWVDCPDCGNVSRPARRRCKAKGGMCKGRGLIQKWVPIRRADEGGAEETNGTEPLARAIYAAISEETGNTIPWEEADPYAQDRFRRPAMNAATVYLREQGLAVFSIADVQRAAGWFGEILDGEELPDDQSTYWRLSDRINAALSTPDSPS